MSLRTRVSPSPTLISSKVISWLTSRPRRVSCDKVEIACDGVENQWLLLFEDLVASKGGEVSPDLLDHILPCGWACHTHFAQPDNDDDGESRMTTMTSLPITITWCWPPRVSEELWWSLSWEAGFLQLLLGETEKTNNIPLSLGFLYSNILYFFPHLFWFKILR